jgi:hypothetical protein
MVSACPWPGIFSISVTPGLSCCCLKEAWTIAHGTVWSSLALCYRASSQVVPIRNAAGMG